MIKHVFIGFLRDEHETDALRFYLRYHSREIVRAVGPWLRRYETYRGFQPPPEAKKYRAVGGYMTELWYSGIDDFVEGRADFRPYTRPPGGWKKALGPVSMAPAMPTEDFLGKEPAPEEKHIIRWIRIFKYPAGVSLADGEKWYLEVNSQQIKTQPQLLRYISYKIPEKLPFVQPWHRMDELWYENFNSWRTANVDNPPAYAQAPWGGNEPFVDMISTFVKCKPDVDFLRDNPQIP